MTDGGKDIPSFYEDVCEMYLVATEVTLVTALIALLILGILARGARVLLSRRSIYETRFMPG